jgi:parallel beta-helix repeat protein/VCBS repeat-containing protein
VIDDNTVSQNNGNGILVAYSTNCSITANVFSSNNRDGISVWKSSNNTFSGNIASGNGEYDFHSDQYSHNNSITSLAIGGSFPTTISFTYDNGGNIKAVETAPANPTGKVDINRYIEVSGAGAGFWMSVKVSYAESDLGTLDEGTLLMWRHDGSTWTQVAAPNSVDTAGNYVSAYIQSSGVFAPLVDAGPSPVAVDNSYTVGEDATLNVAAPGVLGNDMDPDSTTLTAILISGPLHGTVNLSPDGSFTYTPAADYSGADSFTYKANDGQSDSNVATVTITVNPVNDAPVAADDGYSVDEDGSLTVPASGVLGNDADKDGNPLTAVVVSNPTHGTLTLNADGSFTYTPAVDYSGADSFTYKANDGTGESNAATVTITVNPVNDAPVGSDDSYETDEGTVLDTPSPGVLANDTDKEGSALTAVLVSEPSHGTVVVNADGAFSYTPAADYSGTDSFTYRVSDGQVDSGPATVTIDVIPSENTPSGGGWVRAVVPWLAAAVALFVLILVLVARRRRKKKPHPE